MISLALHGGLAAALMWQNSISPVGVNSVTMPIKLEMFHSISKAAMSEVEEQLIEPQPEVQPEPVQSEPPARPEPVVKKTSKVKKQAIRVAKKIPKKKQATVAATKPGAAPPQQFVNSNAASTLPTMSSENFDEIRARYLQQLMSVIAAHKYYPARARRRKLEGQVEIEFVVKANGVIENVRLTSSSGSEVLDKAAIEVLNRAQRFDPLPKELGMESLAFVVPLDYRLL